MERRLAESKVQIRTQNMVVLCVKNGETNMVIFMLVYA